MKKILLALVLGSVLAGLAMPVLISAQAPEAGPRECCNIKRTFTVAGFTANEGRWVSKPDGYCPGVDAALIDKTTNWGIVCMLNTIYFATNWFFYILIILSVILIIWGGFSILFAAGDPEKMKKGRSTIIYALVGVAIALFARVIPAIVQFMIGM